MERHELKEYVTVPQLAARIGKARKTVWLWAKTNKIVAERFGRGYMIPRDEAQRIIDREGE